MKRNPSIFDIDGRRMVQPVNAPEGTKPIAVRAQQARMICKNFDRKGESLHCMQGALVWVIVTHCKEQGIPFVIERGEQTILIRRKT